jgi:hypothetical protein
MKQDFAVAYRIVLDHRRFREAVGLQVQLCTLAVVTLVKIDVEDTTVQYVCFGEAGIGFLYCIHYFEPVCHAVRQKETDKEFFFVIGCLLVHAAKVYIPHQSCIIYAKSSVYITHAFHGRFYLRRYVAPNTTKSD